MRKNNVLSTYKGLPKEIYVLFIGRIINFLARSKENFKVIRIKTDNPTYVFKVYLF